MPLTDEEAADLALWVTSVILHEDEEWRIGESELPHYEMQRDPPTHER